MANQRIGVLCGGGHISSFNAGIRGILKGAEGKYNVLGFVGGYRGLRGGEYVELNPEMINPAVAGTFLGSPREKFADDELEEAARTVRELGLCGVITMGGNDHLSEAERLHSSMNLPVVGWPKTMDNDLSHTYFTLGFPTAVDVGAKMVRDSHTGAITNRKIYVVIPFGRNTDWVPAALATWGAADLIIPGEEEYSLGKVMDSLVSAYVRNGDKYGRPFAVAVMSEGAKIDGLASHIREGEIDSHGHQKLDPNKLAVVLREAAPAEIRGRLVVQPVTYVLRDSPPTPLDRNYATVAGRTCVEMISDGDFGMSVVFTRSPESNVVAKVSRATLKLVSEQRKLKPEGYVDYNNFSANGSFGEYYEPLFGKPPEKEQLIRELFPSLKTI
jgi:6-phosphofructokinase 1